MTLEDFLISKYFLAGGGGGGGVICGCPGAWEFSFRISGDDYVGILQFKCRDSEDVLFKFADFALGFVLFFKVG